MMKTISILSAAIAATLAASSAFALAPTDDSIAASYDARLVVSGSSAFKAAFENELSRVGSSICQTSGTTTYNKYTTQSGGPDLNAYSCLAVPGLLSAAGGERTIIYYRAEGGSVYGLAPISRGTQVLRLTVNSSCSTPAAGATGTCTVNGFNPVADTATGNAINATSQLGISDEEPSRYFGENYPDSLTAAKLQPALTAAERNSLNGSSAALVAQSFSVYINTGTLNSVTSLSRTALANIFQGVYSDWAQVPKNDGSNTAVVGSSLPIVLCRREAGSGTQVAASIFFNNKGCAANGAEAGFASTANPNNLLTVTENNTTALMRSCISGTDGAIGFISSEANATGRKAIKIDNQGTTDQSTSSTNNLGVQTATGDYGFVFEATAQKAAGLGGTTLALANKLISVAQSQASGPTSPSVTFLPAFNGSNTQFPLVTPAGKQPVSCFTRSKNSCLPLQNQC